MTKPFLKWAGGKREVLGQYLKYFPSKVQTYHEPFLGGGSLFFGWARNLAERCVLSDINLPLIQSYQIVRDSPQELIKALEQHESIYRSMESETDRKNYYLAVRSLKAESLSPLEVAVRFIFLNRTCYNGLYRESKRSGYNVPHGKHKATIEIARSKEILVASQALQGTVIVCKSYTEMLDIDYSRDDFVYMDPPYIPLKEGSFTDYTSNGFSLEDHRNCAAVFKALENRGVRVALSNSDTPLSRDLYQGFKVIEISSARAINSKASDRGKVGEILVLSY